MSKIYLDPLEKFKQYTTADMLEQSGALFNWANEPRAENESLKEHVGACYGFGLHESTGGNVDNDCIYYYPEDPPLYPLGVFVDDDGLSVMIVYQYGMVAFIENTGEITTQFITRMD
jgi:hypothetical protein